MLQFIKFFMGIVIVEIATAILFSLSSHNMQGIGLLQFIVPLFFIALLLSFWFSSLSGHKHKDTVSKLKNTFAKEREEIRITAEKNIAKETKIAHAKANFKVGAAFAGVIAIGALFVFAQMITAALLTLATAGGAATGYYYRGKRLSKQEEKLREIQTVEVKAIENKN